MVDAREMKGVSETMLIPLMGRAMETQKSEGIINDPKSLYIYNNIDYDFDKFYDSDIKSSMKRTVIRTCIIDELIKEFISKYPEATIVEIGCGLNTRFNRLDNGVMQWFDLDIQEVYAVWREFFLENERRRFLPYSAFEEEWMRVVAEEASQPYLFISEASVIYFEDKMVNRMFIDIKNHFDCIYYLFDSATSEFLDYIKDGDDPLKFCNADMKWSLENIETLNGWVDGVDVIKRVDIEDSSNSFSHLYPDNFDGYKGVYYLNLIKM